MEILKITGKFNRVNFSKGDFSIASFYPSGDSIGNVEIHPTYGTMSVKGDLPSSLKRGEEYEINAVAEHSPKYGTSYVMQFIKPMKTFNFNDKKEVVEFLKNITSLSRAKEIANGINNIQDVLENGDVEALCEINGIGERTATRIIAEYEVHKDYSQAYIELGKHDIPPTTIRKAVNHFKSVEKAIESILSNPYSLIAIDGYGFKKCDELFLKINVDEYANPIRSRAFIKHWIEEEARSNGHTWTGLVKLVEIVSSEIGATKEQVAKVLGEMIKEDDFITMYDKKSLKVSHKSFLEIETTIALKLFKLIYDKTEFNKENLAKMIEKAEEAQGWEFTGQQVEAINVIADNKVVILEGLAGSGKSTSLKVILDFYESNKYTYAQTALSGKASSNLALITGKEGSTIHRLLGVDMTGNHKYAHHENNLLPYDIIIIDEISMVDAVIFKDLIVAMKDSAKLIMVGDSEQLEAIGVPIMKPLIESGVIPRIMLTEIHRQAKKSAIVTHSIAYRKGIVPPIKSGYSEHGELKDLSYNIVHDDDDIKSEVAKKFLEKLRSGADIMDIQIISPMRSRGSASCHAINTICQKIYNGDETKPSQLIKKGDEEYLLREGDKVINVKNNYNSYTVDDVYSPVFNGNIGILTKYTQFYDKQAEKYIDVAIIDFEGIGEIVYELSELKSIELAYCITIHKSQGMGVKHVIVAYPFAYTLISRQSLYTAITRTKKDCHIVIMMKTLKYAIKKDATKKKRTHLAQGLKLLKFAIIEN